MHTEKSKFADPKFTNLEAVKERYDLANVGVFENQVLIFDKFGKLLRQFTPAEFKNIYGAAIMPTYRGSNERSQKIYIL